MRVIAVVIALAALAACSSTRAPDPVGIGEGINQLKRSPCACTPIPMSLPAEAGGGVGA